jgi:hypothetical protein
MKFDDKILLDLINNKGEIMLGEKFRDKFKVGDYVEWRRICRNENYEESVSYHQGIIVKLRTVVVGGRDVWYADVMQNGGQQDLVLLSRITKVETN